MNAQAVESSVRRAFLANRQSRPDPGLVKMGTEIFLRLLGDGKPPAQAERELLNLLSIGGPGAAPPGAAPRGRAAPAKAPPPPPPPDQNDDLIDEAPAAEVFATYPRPSGFACPSRGRR